METSVKHQGLMEINLQSVCHLLWFIFPCRQDTKSAGKPLAFRDCHRSMLETMMLVAVAVATPDPLGGCGLHFLWWIGRNISNFRWPCVRSDVLWNFETVKLSVGWHGEAVSFGESMFNADLCVTTYKEAAKNVTSWSRPWQWIQLSVNIGK